MPIDFKKVCSMNIYTHTLLTITHLKHLKHDKKGKGKEKAIDGDEPMDIDESWGDRKECIRGLIKGVILRAAKKEIFAKVCWICWRVVSLYYFCFYVNAILVRLYWVKTTPKFADMPIQWSWGPQGCGRAKPDEEMPKKAKQLILASLLGQAAKLH